MSAENDLDVAMEFPDGTRVLSRRTTKTARDGNLQVEEDVEVMGRAAFTWTSGPAWMFELISVKEGSISFTCDGQRVEPESKRFGLLYSMFSITETCFDNVKFHWFGFGGASLFPCDWMNRSLIFDLSDGATPSTTDELIEMLRERRDFKPIEKVSRPSPLSQNVKTIIDSTYNTELSIARIARALGVSHPHLTRQFKKEFGMTPIDYCHRVRAIDASSRLMRGEQIINVSLDVGYNDLGRFYKQFRKKMKSSPGGCKTAQKIPSRAM